MAVWWMGWDPLRHHGSQGMPPAMVTRRKCSEECFGFTQDETGCAVPVTVELDFFSSSYLDMVVLLLSQMIW